MDEPVQSYVADANVRQDTGPNDYGIFRRSRYSPDPCSAFNCATGPLALFFHDLGPMSRLTENVFDLLLCQERIANLHLIERVSGSPFLETPGVAAI